MTGPGAAAAVRLRIRVEGIAQGVGFRPYVLPLATTLVLSGFVRNEADSQHVPRIQEAQATAYHLPRELVEVANS